MLTALVVSLVGAAPVDSVVLDAPATDAVMLLARTTGIFTETAGGVTVAVLTELARRGDIDPDERVVAVITGEGLKTLDAVRGSFEAHEIAPSVESFDAAFSPALA